MARDRQKELSWREVSELIALQGNEAWIASRVRAWREERGWKQSVLVKELERLKVPISQPAISRIENMGLGSGKDERRSISVREAMALAQVFDVSLAELLLPPGALDEVTGWQDFLECAEELNRVRSAWRNYEIKVGSLQRKIRASESLRARVENARDAAEARFRADMQRWFDRNGVAMGFGSLDELLDVQEPTPELAALRDSLSVESVNPFGWADARTLSSQTARRT